MMKFNRKLAVLFVLGALAGCSDSSGNQQIPLPAVLTAEAAGHYCQMIVLDHDGPKAQIHLSGFEAPLWFSQVRDGIAYVKSPEQSAQMIIMYVNDMGAADSWAEPGDNNWIDAKDAYYVVGSDAVGGMGAPELVPFAQQEQAQEFADERGGVVKRLSDISAEEVLAPVDFDNTSAGDHA